MSTFESFLGEAVGAAAGFAAGRAVGPVIAPVLRALENETWQEYPDQPLALLSAAQAVAEGKTLELDPLTEAAKQGYGQKAFDSLVAVIKVAPGVAAAQELRRRGMIDDAGFTLALQRAGLEQKWIDAYNGPDAEGLRSWQHPLSPADLALGLIRGNLETFTAPSGPAFPQGLSSDGSNVPPDPVLGLDVVKEAAASGIDADRMALLARNVGLPPGVIEGLNMLNRGIINEASFALLIEQSDARLSWGPFLIQLRRMLLTPHEYTELYLRGWITQDEMLAGTALHGLTPEDTQLLYDVQGRPLGIHAITTAIARGGKFQPQPNGPQDPYDAYVHWSNLRPEMYELAKANAYSYPSLFQLNTLVKAHAITADTAREWAYKQGYATEVLDALHAYWATFATVTGGKNFTVGEIKAAWKAGQLDPDQTRARLEALGYTAADANILINTWASVPAPLPPTA